MITKRTKGQTLIYKKIHRKLMIEQHELIKWLTQTLITTDHYYKDKQNIN